MDSHPGCGGCTAKLLNPDGSAQWVITETPTIGSYARQLLVDQNLAEIRGGWRRRLSRKCGFRGITPVRNLTGACMFLRREALEAAGHFDEGYNFYFEDCDLSRRLVQGGWKLFIVPDARIVHRGGATLGEVRATGKIEEYRSAVRFFGGKAAPALKTLWLATAGLRAAAYLVLAALGRRKAGREARAYWRVLKRLAAGGLGAQL
jgi:hypothetical protein